MAEFDPQSLRDHIDDVTDTVQQAENDVKKKRAEQEVEWETLQQRLRVAKSDLEKARLELKASEVRTDIERELLKLSTDEAEAAYREICQGRSQHADSRPRRATHAGDHRPAP